MSRQSGTPVRPSTAAQDPCAKLVDEADDRVSAATAARAAEAGLLERLLDARARLEERTRAAHEADVAADPEQLDVLRDQARDRFQAASAAARLPAEIAEAGTTWLAEVDRLSDLAAAALARRERARADLLIATALEAHLAAEADAARRLAERAESAAAQARGRAETCVAEAAARAAAERAEAARIEAERTAAEAAAVARAAEAERAEAERAEAERAEAERAEAERAEAERAEAERAEAERAEAERAEAERAEAERAEAERAAPEPPTTGAGAEAATPATAAEALGLSTPARAREEDPPADDGGRLTPRSTLSRILAGELGHLDAVAERLAPDGPEAERWRDLLDQLCEALLHRAIEAGALEVPATHEFWSAFTGEQARDVLSALAALGFRADGLGGWQDERVPSQREISIAVAHAGLDPMRIRHWPTHAEAIELVRDAQVLGGEYVTAVAPSLEARQLRLILGGEQGRFAELWAAWNRIRPLLLEVSLESEAGGGGARP